MGMWIANTIQEARDQRAALSGRVALVPTMGALHEGHLSLIRHASQIADHVLVSIFVNPTQFAPTEDLDQYPKPLEADLEHCRLLGVTGAFCPSVDQMYPAGQLACDVQVPALAGILEGAIRPGHFAGVCRVVAKLFNIIQPDDACFGQKDYQQLKIIDAMVRDLAMPIRIVRCPTVREPDGLAMSSRNVYLSEQQRADALGLFKALSGAKEQIVQGAVDVEQVERQMADILKDHGVELDYAVVRDGDTLGALDQIDLNQSGGVVVLVAGKVGPVRLIDNMILSPDTSEADRG